MLSNSALNALKEVENAINAGLIKIQDAAHEQAATRITAQRQARVREPSEDDKNRDYFLQKIRGKIVSILLFNYHKSNVGKRSGKLENALKNISARYIDGRIVIAMPAGESPYEYTNKMGKTTKSEAYKVWWSLEHGAVRTPTVVRPIVDQVTGETRYGHASIIGKKAKKSIKNEALGKKRLSDKQVSRIELGAYHKLAKIRSIGFHIGVIAKETKTSVEFTGGAVVIKPKPFWKLSQAQWDEIKKLYAESFGFSKGVAAIIAKTTKGTQHGV